MFSSCSLIRKLASLINRDAHQQTRRRRSTAFESLYGGFGNPGGSFMQRSRSLFSPDQLNSLIRRKTIALQLINGSFFLLMREVIVKTTIGSSLAETSRTRTAAEEWKKWNYWGIFFPFRETKNRNLTAQPQHVSCNDKLFHCK